jgi:hypothetical protein
MLRFWTVFFIYPQEAPIAIPLLLLRQLCYTDTDGASCRWMRGD